MWHISIVCFDLSVSLESSALHSVHMTVERGSNRYLLSKKINNCMLEVCLHSGMLHSPSPTF